MRRPSGLLALDAAVEYAFACAASLLCALLAALRARVTADHHINFWTSWHSLSVSSYSHLLSHTTLHSKVFTESRARFTGPSLRAVSVQVQAPLLPICADPKQNERGACPNKDTAVWPLMCLRRLRPVRIMTIVSPERRGKALECVGSFTNRKFFRFLRLLVFVFGRLA